MIEREGHKPGASVRFLGAAKAYPDGTVALRSADLAVSPGEFCVLLGPSGAGKSTLLRAVNGLVTLDAGRIEVDSLEVGGNGWRRHQRRIGMIHQEFNLIDRLSVLKNVLCGALPDTSSWRAYLHWFPPKHLRSACALLERVGLGQEHLTRRAADLSGGQQQRVGIARAFILQPNLVLADEPVASLDAKTSAEILALLAGASSERKATVICSLHQVSLAREFADRIVGMREGRIVFDGTPSDLTDRALAEIYGQIPGIPPPHAT